MSMKTYGGTEDGPASAGGGGGTLKAYCDKHLPVSCSYKCRGSVSHPDLDLDQPEVLATREESVEDDAESSSPRRDVNSSPKNKTHAPVEVGIGVGSSVPFAPAVTDTSCPTVFNSQ